MTDWFSEKPRHDDEGLFAADMVPCVGRDAVSSWRVVGSTHALTTPPSAFAGTPQGRRRVAELVDDALRARGVHREGPLPAGGTPEIVGRIVSELGDAKIPERGCGEQRALESLARVVDAEGIDLTHPFAAAHLQPPVLSAAVAADVLASMSNASVDTFDSGPVGVTVERWVIRALAEAFGLPASAVGALTPGGSMSNLMGLLLARDAWGRRHGVDIRRDGLPTGMRPVILCSAIAHFSVQRAAAALGMGESAVVSVPVDAERRMRLDAARSILDGLPADRSVMAIVATAGTTDFGSVDPLHALADLAAERGAWLHVDAAYGWAARFSRELGPMLDGIERADSVTLDLHKLGWMPAATSVLLCRSGDGFDAVSREVAYLNPGDDALAGYGGQLGKSLQTTRRADALKAATVLRAYGSHRLGQMVDHCHRLARHAELTLDAHSGFDVVAPARLTTVVFRLATPALRAAAADALHAEVRRALMRSGTALIGRTTTPPTPGADAAVCLKLTFTNPLTTRQDVDALLTTILDTARSLMPGVRSGGAMR